MKKNSSILRTLAVGVVLVAAALHVQAQGIYVNKKNGESIAYPKAIFDRVTPTTQGAQRGVDVWKNDGTKDTYMENELTSITTYEVDFDDRITQDIPEEYLTKMSAYMPIYSGNTPPNIEGVYKMSTTVMVYNSDVNSSYQAGKEFNDVVPEYTEQNMSQNTVQFRYQQRSGTTVTSNSSKEEAKVLGEGDTFTTYTVVETNSSDGLWSKTATLCSGKKVNGGVKDFFYAILMLDKTDPNGQMMNVGDFRVFKDKDGMSENDAWRARMKTPVTIEDQLPNVLDAGK